MKTAYEAALDRFTELRREGCPVPPMTHPLSRHWSQPDPTAWLFSDTEVLMPQADFDRLLDYSHSQPTGVYEGKMWRKGKPWYLHWWGPSELPDHCSNHVRKIVIV